MGGVQAGAGCCFSTQRREDAKGAKEFNFLSQLKSAT